MTKDVAGILADRAGAWIESLTSEQRAVASLDLSDEEERRSWAYFPRDHKGLPLHDMDRSQQKLAHALLASCLSLPAYAKTCTIMALESVLNAIEERRLDGWRDPERYFFSMFGDPTGDAWAFRVEGHHVCLNFTVVDGEVAAVTPLFLGSNPAEVRHEDYAVIRPVGEEQDAGFEMLASLDAGQRAKAVLTVVAPPDFVLLNAPEIPERFLPGEAGGFPPLQAALRGMPEEAREALAFDRAAPKGLPATDMTGAQRGMLERLVRVYIERVPERLAESEMSRIDLDALHFAWAGTDRPGEGHYYRVQGGPLVIEYDNTQDSANHIHAVWRDAERDFGGDVLRRHLVREHAPRR